MKNMRIRSHAYPVFRIETSLAGKIPQLARSPKTLLKSALFVVALREPTRANPDALR
ncbi:MAG: hypothetical protein HOP03_02235 [Lysobacter sp.]|nr:hypothetical protein [Lysobacter sp.]